MTDEEKLTEPILLYWVVSAAGREFFTNQNRYSLKNFLRQGGGKDGSRQASPGRWPGGSSRLLKNSK